MESPILIDLGESDVIDEHIIAYRNEMKRIVGDYIREWRLEEGILSEISKWLYNTVFEPIKECIGNSKHLYLSPDGDLNLIPFEVFMKPDGEFLIEEYEINYVSAGRDIIKFSTDKVKGKNVVIFADPDFELDIFRKKDVLIGLGIKDIIKTDAIMTSVPTNIRSLRFGRLKGTEDEAKMIATIFKERYGNEPRIYLDTMATE